MSQVIAQEKETGVAAIHPYAVDAIPVPLNCFIPQIEAQAAILTTRGTELVYLRFEHRVPHFLDIFTIGGRSVSGYNLSEKEIIFDVANAQKGYHIDRQNSCGDIVRTTIAGDSEFVQEQDFIDVSVVLYELLGKFVKDAKPLPIFLREDHTISIFEKVSLYQDYALGGQAIAVALADFTKIGGLASGTKLLEENAFGLKANFKDPESCLCQSVRVVPKHHSGYANGGVTPWYTEFVTEKLNTTNEKEDVGAGGVRWNRFYALGAAKWQELHSQGYKRHKQAEEDQVQQTHDFEQTNHGVGGTIRVHLICMNADGLPENCACDKSGMFSYHYNSYVSAQAILHDGGTSQQYRRAKATTEDAVLAYYYLEGENGASTNEFFPLAGMANTIAAQCGQAISPDFEAHIRTLGDKAIDVFIKETGHLGTNGDIDTYQDLMNSIMGVFTIPSHVSSPSTACTGGESYDGMSGHFTFTLQPNQPLTFGVMSLGKNMVSGRRSWYSVSKMTSAYGMSLTLQPGGTDSLEMACCTPLVTGYLVAAPFDTPTAEESMQRAIGSTLYNQGFEEGSPNGLRRPYSNYYVRGNSGTMSQQLLTENCPVSYTPEVVAISTTPYPDIVDIRYSLQKNGGHIVVYDMMGQQIEAFELPPTMPQPLLSIRKYIQDRLVHQASMYIIQVKSADQQYSYKLIAH